MLGNNKTRTPDVQAGHFGENAECGWWAICWDRDGEEYSGRGNTRPEAVNAAIDNRYAAATIQRAAREAR